MELSLLIILPLITCLLILFSGTLQKVRVVALAGSLVQLVYVLWLLVGFLKKDPAMGMHLEYSVVWFKNLNLQYHVGLDGIGLSMILLTSLIVISGLLVSWNMEKMSREYFFCWYY